LDAYRAADYFHLAYIVNNVEDMRFLIDSNKARAGIIIPYDFGKTISSGKVAHIAFVIDGSDPTLAGTALSAATLIGQAESSKIITQRVALSGQVSLKMPVEVDTQIWYNPGLVSADYMIPALIGLILQVLTTILTSTSIVRERERGTIEQLIVTPIRSWELVVGKLAPYVLIAFFDTFEILVVGVLVFKVPINGSLALFLGMIGLFLITTLGIGLLISTFSNTQQEAMLTTMFTILPSIFLSGFFFPLAAMPIALQAISYAIPLRYFLIIARGIVLKGVGVEAMWSEILALAFFALVVMGAAAARFHKRLD
jgi:ABC-2 type transport system permease protein